MNSLIKYFNSVRKGNQQINMKTIAKNIGIMLAISVAIVIVALWILKFYTKHNQKRVVVPMVEGIVSSDAIKKLEDAGLKAEVVDTVYKDGAKKLEVINQNPEGAQQVKKGRRVYLVINSDQIPMVVIPDLVGKTSLSQARNMLSRAGLRLGKVIEKPCDFVRSRSDEPVIGQFAHGDSINLRAGGMIERNSTIDLVICVPVEAQDSITSGLGISAGQDEVPEVF